MIILLIIFSTPLAFAEYSFTDSWKVVKQVDGQWVEIPNAKVKTHYYINIGNDFIKYDKSFTNTESDEIVVGFQQTITLDPTFGYDLPSHKLIQPPLDFIYMLMLFGLIAVVVTIIIIKFDKITQQSFTNVGVEK
uniref:ORF43 n=1 Tax=Nitrosopumilaceae spindle-shaped virus TaxID=3065433 RepID=A0AAT9J7L9_9VIRU